MSYFYGVPDSENETFSLKLRRWKKTCRGLIFKQTKLFKQQHQILHFVFDTKNVEHVDSQNET